MGNGELPCLEQVPKKKKRAYRMRLADASANCRLVVDNREGAFVRSRDFLCWQGQAEIETVSSLYDSAS